MPRKRTDRPAAPAATRASLLEFADAVAVSDTPAAVQPAAPPLHLVTFVLDREEFGIPIGRVREVLRVGDITRVPEAPPHIRGVTSVRGRILPIVELRTRLGLPGLGEPGTRARIVVVEAHGRVLGLLVDAVNQVVNVPADSVLDPPGEVLSAQTDYVTGIGRLDARLIILLDLDRALLLAEAA
jgi:purine-binding chemotaxis protein CheW